MSTVTLRNAILEARAALTGFTALTDLIPERRITFGNSPQKDRKPRIVIEVSNTDYEATYLASRKVQTYTVEYAVYSESVDQCTAVMDEIRNALDAYTSSEFAVRVSDETFQAQADNVLVGVVISTFQDTDGVPGYDATVGVALAQAQQDLADAQQDLADAQAATADAVQAETDAWESAVGMTLDEYENLPAPQIAYPNFLQMDNWRYSEPTQIHGYGANSYDALLAADAYSPGNAPQNVSHVAEIDRTDLAYLKTLVNNNEFGNKHRFTYDDGTEATEIITSSTATIINHATDTDGYTGSNPQYIIDHYTGLGWHRRSFQTGGTSTSTAWYDANGLHDYFTDLQDFVDKPSELTLHGYSDWRVATYMELANSVSIVDNSSIFVNLENFDRDPYFPPLNGYGRAFGAVLQLAGPIDTNNNNPNTSSNADWRWPWFQTSTIYNVTDTNAMTSAITSGTNHNRSHLLVRRHYSNS